MPRAENAPAAGAKRSRPRRPPGLHPFVPPSLDLEDVLRAVVASAAEISGAALVTIWTADEDTRILERQAVSDDRLAREYPFRTQSYGSGGVGWVALHRRPLNVRRVADDARLIARDWCQARGLTSYLGLPIAFEGALLPKSDRFVDVNEQAVRLARLTRAELLQRGLLELLPHPPAGRPIVARGGSRLDPPGPEGGQAHVRVDP